MWVIEAPASWSWPVSMSRMSSPSAKYRNFRKRSARVWSSLSDAMGTQRLNGDMMGSANEADRRGGGAGWYGADLKAIVVGGRPVRHEGVAQFRRHSAHCALQRGHVHPDMAWQRNTAFVLSVQSMSSPHTAWGPDQVGAVQTALEQAFRRLECHAGDRVGNNEEQEEDSGGSLYEYKKTI